MTGGATCNTTEQPVAAERGALHDCKRNQFVNLTEIDMPPCQQVDGAALATVPYSPVVAFMSTAREMLHTAAALKIADGSAAWISCSSSFGPGLAAAAKRLRLSRPAPRATCAAALWCAYAGGGLAAVAGAARVEARCLEGAQEAQRSAPNAARTLSWPRGCSSQRAAASQHGARLASLERTLCIAPAELPPAALTAPTA